MQENIKAIWKTSKGSKPILTQILWKLINLENSASRLSNGSYIKKYAKKYLKHICYPKVFDGAAGP